MGECLSGKSCKCTWKLGLSEKHVHMDSHRLDTFPVLVARTHTRTHVCVCACVGACLPRWTSRYHAPPALFRLNAMLYNVMNILQLYDSVSQSISIVFTSNSSQRKYNGVETCDRDSALWILTDSHTCHWTYLFTTKKRKRNMAMHLFGVALFKCSMMCLTMLL